MYEENADLKSKSFSKELTEEQKNKEENPIENIISSPSNEINRDQILDNLNEYTSTMNFNVKQQTQSHEEKNVESSKKEKEKYSKDQNKKILFKLFLNYSEYSVETGQPRMNSKNFIKLMKDAEIFDKLFGIIQGDLVFSEFSKKLGKFFDFECFLNCLVSISEYKFPKEPKKKGLKILLKAWLIPFYKKIEEANVKSKKDNSIVYDDSVKLLLNSKYHMLRVLFTKYIDNPIKKFKTKSECMKALNKLWINLLREFDLLPFYIGIQKSLALLENAFASESEINSIVNLGTIFELPNNYNILTYKITDFGYFLKFSRFYYLLVITSNAIIDKDKDKFTPVGYITKKKYSIFFTGWKIPKSFLIDQKNSLVIRRFHAHFCQARKFLIQL